MSPRLAALTLVLALPSAAPFRLPTSTAVSRAQPIRSVKLDPEVDATTKKYGLEGGLFSIFTSRGEEGNKSAQAKELLQQYGAAYLVTSISLALVSFSICYVLVDTGVDVASLFAKVNIDATAATEKAGTVAIAYAFHKAASPIRFPPTVALTPVVAKFLKQKED
mmetsp:Transcript_6455/g.19603  ORF Transcript_6455/g.19603 Transcript_6455/m.19603 type:complete len:165 (+) Transcript_6455:68-562(+)